MAFRYTVHIRLSTLPQEGSATGWQTLSQGHPRPHRDRRAAKAPHHHIYPSPSPPLLNSYPLNLAKMILLLNLSDPYTCCNTTLRKQGYKTQT